MGFWEQLPYTNFHNLNLTELVKFVNDTIKKINEMSADIVEQNQAIEDFKEYVNNYLDNLDVEQDVIDYINELLTDGTILELFTTATSKWSNRNVLLVGDSYLDGWDGDTTVNSYGYYLNSILNFKNYYHVHTGGAGFGYANSTHFYTLIENFVNSNTQETLESINDIFIFGGYNDRDRTQNDIIENTPYGISATISYIKTNFINARIHIGMIGRALYSPDMDWTKFNTVLKAYKDGAIVNGVHYVPNCELCLHDYKNFAADGVHPTDTGYYTLGVYLARILLDGDFTFTRNVIANNTFNMDFTGTAFTSFLNIYQTIRRYNVMLHCYGGIVSFTSTNIHCGYANSDWVKIGNFKVSSNRNLIMPEYDIITHIPCFIQYDSNTKVVSVDANLIFRSNGDLYLSVLKPPTGWNFDTLNDATRMCLGQFEVTFPIDAC